MLNANIDNGDDQGGDDDDDDDDNDVITCHPQQGCQ